MLVLFGIPLKLLVPVGVVVKGKEAVWVLLNRPVVVYAANQQLLNLDHIAVELAHGINQHIEAEGITGTQIQPAAGPVGPIFHHAHVVHQGRQGPLGRLQVVAHPAQLNALLMALQVFSIEASQFAEKKPTLEQGFDVAALGRAQGSAKPHPDPAVEGIELAKTDIHGRTSRLRSGRRPYPTTPGTPCHRSTMLEMPTGRPCSNFAT